MIAKKKFNISWSSSENTGNHYQIFIEIHSHLLFSPSRKSCPVLLTWFKVSWYSWPSPSLFLLYTGRMQSPVALHLSHSSRWSHSPLKSWLLLLQTGPISPDVLRQDPALGLLMGVEVEGSHPLVGLNQRPALGRCLKIIHSIWCIQRYFYSGGCCISYTRHCRI